MRIIVCSDNHGDKEILMKLKEKYRGAKAFIHCGDMEMTKEEMEGFYVVTGNNDYLDRFPNELVVDLEEIKVFVTHSHKLPFGQRTQALAHIAKSYDCILACHGHTHIPHVTEIDGVTCLNPGSLRYNRDGSRPSYAVVDVNDGELDIHFHTIDEL